jgi:hypothetical protein
MQQLLLYLAGEEFRRVLPGWVNSFRGADDHAHGALTATLRAYANADMNVLKAAHTLGVHPNTLYARFQHIFRLTGLQPRTFNDLTALLIVCECKRDAIAAPFDQGANPPAKRLRRRRAAISRGGWRAPIS